MGFALFRRKKRDSPARHNTLAKGANSSDKRKARGPPQTSAPGLPPIPPISPLDVDVGNLLKGATPPENPHITIYICPSAPPSAYLPSQLFIIPLSVIQKSNSKLLLETAASAAAANYQLHTCIPDLDPAAFSLYVEYLHTGRIAFQPHLFSHSSTPSHHIAECYPLINAHTLSQHIGDAPFGTYILSLLKQKVDPQLRIGTALIDDLFSGRVPDTGGGLRKFIVECFLHGVGEGGYIEPEQMDAYPLSFLQFALRGVLEEGRKEIWRRANANDGSDGKCKSKSKSQPKSQSQPNADPSAPPSPSPQHQTKLSALYSTRCKLLAAITTRESLAARDTARGNGVRGVDWAYRARAEMRSGNGKVVVAPEVGEVGGEEMAGAVLRTGEGEGGGTNGEGMIRKNEARLESEAYVIDARAGQREFHLSSKGGCEKAGDAYVPTVAAEYEKLANGTIATLRTPSPSTDVKDATCALTTTATDTKPPIKIEVDKAKAPCPPTLTISTALNNNPKSAPTIPPNTSKTTPPSKPATSIRATANKNHTPPALLDAKSESTSTSPPTTPSPQTPLSSPATSNPKSTTAIASAIKAQTPTTDVAQSAYLPSNEAVDVDTREEACNILEYMPGTYPESVASVAS